MGHAPPIKEENGVKNQAEHETLCRKGGSRGREQGENGTCDSVIPGHIVTLQQLRHEAEP